MQRQIGTLTAHVDGHEIKVAAIRIDSLGWLYGHDINLESFMVNPECWDYKPGGTTADKCRIGAMHALVMMARGKLSSQCNEEFARFAGVKLRYRNRADFIDLLKFYARDAN